METVEVVKEGNFVKIDMQIALAKFYTLLNALSNQPELKSLLVEAGEKAGLIIHD